MFLLLLFFLPLLPPSSCQGLTPSALMPDAENCYNISIPYPFGIMGRYSLGLEYYPSFGIFCDGSAPMLRLPSGLYKIVNISLPEGTITILGHSVAWRCRVNNKTSTNSSTPPPDLVVSIFPLLYTELSLL